MCPKCRSFYSRETLGFCSNDGVLLIEVSKNGDNWQIGEKFLRNSKKTLRKKQIITTIKKVIIYTVTTVIFASVTAVVIVNAVIYLTHKNDLVKKNEPILEKQEIKIDEDLGTFESPTLIPIITPNPTKTLVTTPCDKELENKKLNAEHLTIWTNLVEKERAKVENYYARMEKQFGLLDIKKSFSQEIKINSKCSDAEVIVHFEIYAEIQGQKLSIDRGKVKLPKVSYTKFICKKNDNWTCSLD